MALQKAKDPENYLQIIALLVEITALESSRIGVVSNRAASLEFDGTYLSVAENLPEVRRSTTLQHCTTPPVPGFPEGKAPFPNCRGLYGLLPMALMAVSEALSERSEERSDEENEQEKRKRTGEWSRYSRSVRVLVRRYPGPSIHQAPSRYMRRFFKKV